MKTRLQLTLLAFATLCFVTSCKDDEDGSLECCACSFQNTVCENNFQGGGSDWATYRDALVALGCTCATGSNVNNNNNNNNNSTVCVGNNESTFMPLKLANRWFLAYNGSGSFFDRRVKVTGSKTYNSVSYFVVLNEEVNGSSGSSFHDWEIYLRKASNGDVFKYDETDAAEYLYLPVNPTANQTICTYLNGNYRKVTSASQSFSTDNCDYTGVIKVEDFSSSGSSTNTSYYKKGVGFVGEKGFAGNLELEEITLN